MTTPNRNYGQRFQGKEMPLQGSNFALQASPAAFTSEKSHRPGFVPSSRESAVRVGSGGALEAPKRGYSPASSHDSSVVSSAGRTNKRVVKEVEQIGKGAVYLPGDRVVIAENSAMPGVPLVYRTPDERAANPDRLNLDRRRLTVCPTLEGEDQLRLLNYQHNQIRRIEHLAALRRLIFLDLYDNHIEQISGLTSLRLLRVLMLGKNRIRRIENLETHTKLDVLDLHGNKIQAIEGLSHLSELRVLNLASNEITHVDNLSGLDSLAEINLKRNRIRTVRDVESLPCLQRLYLSFNDLVSFDHLLSISDCASLSELSLDGNPIAQDPVYRQTVLGLVTQLRQLDNKRITDDERRSAAAMVRRDEDRRRDTNRNALIKDKRRLGARGQPGSLGAGGRPWDTSPGTRQWEMQQGSVMVRSQRIARMPELHASHVATLPVSYSSGTGYGEEDDLDVGMSERSSRSVSARSTELEPLGSASGSDARPPSQPSTISRHHKRSVLSPDSSRGGSGSGARPGCRLVELDGHTLTLFGPGALDELNHSWGVQAAGAVTDVVFKYIDFDELVKHLPKVRARFPGTQHLVFTGCNLWSLQQLNALASVRRLSALTVEAEGNPVTQMLFFRSYVLYRLSHFNIKRINGEDVSPNEVQLAEKIFGPIVSMTTAALPPSRLMSVLGETSFSEYQQALVRQHAKSKKRNNNATTESDTSKKSIAAKLSLEQAGKAALSYTPSEQLENKHKDTSRRDQARSVVSEVSHEALWSDRKRKQIAALWPQMFQDAVCSVLRDLQHPHVYAKTCLEKLEPPKF